MVFTDECMYNRISAANNSTAHAVHSDMLNTFLKTVSAFENYDGGQIIFGVTDNGKPVGLADSTQVCLDGESILICFEDNE